MTTEDWVKFALGAVAGYYVVAHFVRTNAVA